MSTVTLIHDDCKVALRRLIDEGVRVHSIVTDPPYGLISIRKRFGGNQAPARTEGNDGSFARLSGGFMGKAWDATGIEHDVEFWRLCLEILLPGGYLLAFSSPRTGHRMACAIEDAGFIIHPFIGWAYGSGFPKSHAADKAIDKALGKKGRLGAPKPGHEGFIGRDNMRSLRESGTMSQKGGFSRPWMFDPEKVEASHYSYVPATEEAARWSGWAYGGQARKPALEPIYVAQRPFSEKNGALNILKHGVGAVNIDGCRVPASEDDIEAARVPQPEFNSPTGLVYNMKTGKGRNGQVFDMSKGRHPANLIHDGSSEVVAQFPEDKKGSAARFFECYPFEDQKIFYHSKATRADRAGSRHPTVKPIGLLRALVRHVTPPGGIVLDPFAGTGTTGEAACLEGCDSILIEFEPEYVADIERRFGIETPAYEYLRLLGWLE
jgi:site-specific DNA-methyltransferase (adenine-specific)